MRGANVYRAVPDGCQRQILSQLAGRCSRLWNATQYLCRSRFLRGERVPSDARLCALMRDDPAYRALPSDVAQEVLKKAAEGRRAYFATVRVHREGRLPRPPRPPGYWKDRCTGHRLIRCIPIKSPRSYSLSSDTFAMTMPRDLAGDRLVLRLRGYARYRGTLGRAELVWDSTRRAWYLHISVEVDRPCGRSCLRRVAAVDRGARIPLAVAVEGSREVLLFRGREPWKEYRYGSRRIARTQQAPAPRGRRTSRALRRLHARRRARMLAA